VPHEVPIREHRESRRLRVGWVGLGKNLRNLDAVAGALAARADRIEVVVISNERYAHEGLEVTHVPWSKDTQEAEIASLDAGIMPLAEDTPFTRGKCGYKLLQYMAAGVPCIASPVGMNRVLIHDGENGFLASSPEAWIAAIDALGSVERRAELGARGRRTVLAEYTYPIQADRWASFLRALAECRR
jgi:glycosyltransferase involved in cell wall biosynthesis